MSKTAADGPTEAVDYLVLKRKRISYDDQGGSKYYGLNLPNNDVKTRPNPNVVYIAMPNNIQTAYRPTYRQVDMGVLGMALSGALGDYTTENLTQVVQQAAEAALPEFASQGITEIAKSASNFLGLAGNFDVNSIQALAKGRVFNPYTEQLFSNMQFRSHNFSFKMFARNQSEAQMIAKIIRYVKEGALPRYPTEDGKISNTRFFEVPDKFDLKFIRVNANSSNDVSSNVEDLHFKIHTSVCTNIDVNYTPDGQYNAFKDILAGVGSDKPTHVPAVVMNCQFTETQFVTSGDISKGY